ncbi:IS5 family transposase [Dankookia rubra]|uniref:IS5 family transposase n=1 Tax=Dankookia rubra TaxID=1442381 RepID=A0A4R5QDA5_9PROT|nr:IS5 family transposase [Dankookia rubra]
MERLVLRDDQWERTSAHIIGTERTRGSSGRDTRMFVEGVLWTARTGNPWRDLAEVFGAWNSVFRRFGRWAAKGMWDRVFAVMSDDLGFEYLIIDSTVVRTHQHAPRAKKGLRIKPRGRSRGGPSTKLRLAVRGLGCPARTILTAGQRGDARQALAPLGEDQPEAVPADAAYASGAFRPVIVEAGTVAVIPNNPSRAIRHPFKEAPYKERHLVECCFSRLKQFRRVATRHEGTARNYLAIINPRRNRPLAQVTVHKT